jgi:uncharacterized membrane protein
MASNRIKKMATAGVLSSVVIVLGVTGLGFIILPFGASITILQVPAIIGAILEGPLVGLFIGLLFGAFSVIQSALLAATPIDMAFLSYPFIAVVPRILIGPAAWLVYALIGRHLGKKNVAGGVHTEAGMLLESAAIGAGAIIGSLTNTALVLAGLGVMGVFPWEVIIPVAITNGPLEATGSAIITFIVVTLWKQLPVGGGRSRLSKETERGRRDG